MYLYVYFSFHFNIFVCVYVIFILEFVSASGSLYLRVLAIKSLYSH